MRTKRTAIAFLLALAATSTGIIDNARAMTVKQAGNQLILSGPVVGNEFAAVVRALDSASVIDTVILRNSPGGDVPTGYRLGELFRARGLRTAVSGYCVSSCSRMFLGGKDRFFTDDYPPQYTFVGFHGHYDRNGNLLAKQVESFHLKDWIVRYSDGKADPALVERWIHIPRNTGLIRFYHPGRVSRHGVSTFMCQGDEPAARRGGDCEPIAKTALDLGIVTSLDILHSNDPIEPRPRLSDVPPPSGYADVADLDKVPLTGEHWQAEYRRFLAALPPKAIAVAPDGKSWAWNSGGVDVMSRALARCADRSKQPCRLYAVDLDVVYVKP